MTQVEALAKYAARASFADLSAESRRRLPIHILDSLACCIAALGARSRQFTGRQRHRKQRDFILFFLAGEVITHAYQRSRSWAPR
jgi:2-methylcitrate dehydratase PrpD